MRVFGFDYIYFMSTVAFVGYMLSLLPDAHREYHNMAFLNLMVWAVAMAIRAEIRNNK